MREIRFFLVAVVFGCSVGARADLPKDATTSGIIRIWPELMKAVESNTDLWGEQALAQPGGPSYEFFKKVCPTFRYVDTEFLHYPIVLSGPGAMHKARLVSNGSGVNALANHPRIWKEIGIPVTFRVGDELTTYGEDLHRLNGPRYLNGYLPVVQMDYTQGAADYGLEAFTPTDGSLVEHAPVFLAFELKKGTRGTIAADVGVTEPVTEKNGMLIDDHGQLVVSFDSSWKWNASSHRLTAALTPKHTATLAVFTTPTDNPLQINPATYETYRKHCVGTWENLVSQSTLIETPEAVVNDAYRSLIVGNLMLIKGNVMNYSSGNQYEQLYEAEGSDAVRGMMLCNFVKDMPRLIVPLLNFTRKGLIYHQAGLKLQLLCHYYWISRDAAYIREQRPRWEKEVGKILNDRETSGGLLPKEQFAGDIKTPIYSLNSNGNCWRGLRDFAAVLDDMGEKEEAKRYADEAAKFRKVVVDAAEKSVDHNVTPPFVPLALFNEIPINGRLTATRLGGYYDLMVPYIIGSEVLGIGSEAEKWMIDTLQQRGGICMGMIRGAGINKMYGGVFGGVNNLYGLRYTLALLKRDDVDRALVSFYGKLAQGMTENTYISGEGSGMAPYDEFGRVCYDPPNSAANAFFLQMLRYMLVQDWDMNDDGKPDTLRLMFATPARWLENGAKIRIEHAPTAFGEVGVQVNSRLAQGEVDMEVHAPARNVPAHTYLKCRVPAGHKVVEATVAGKKLKLDDKGTADVSALRGTYTVKFRVQ